MQDNTCMVIATYLFLDETIQRGSLQIVADYMGLILCLDAEVKVLSDVNVLLGHLRLIVLVSSDLDLVGTQDLTQCTGVVVEEGFAQIVEILGSKFYEHLELRFLDFLEDILVIERAIELRLRFTT